MNSYITIFFWTVALLLLAMAVVHFVKVLKNKDKTTLDTTKAIVYVSGAVSLILVLVYKPFDTSHMKIGRLAKFLKPKPVSLETTTAEIVTTSMSGGPTTGVMI